VLFNLLVIPGSFFTAALSLFYKMGHGTNDSEVQEGAKWSVGFGVVFWMIFISAAIWLWRRI
jgi:hypothetical protein